MNGGAVMVAVVVLAALAVILMVLYLRHRNLQMLHQERMSALEKGTTVPVGRALIPWSPRVYLLRGLMWSFSGAALVICLLGMAAASHRPEPADVMMWRAKSISQNLNIPIDQAQQIMEKDCASHEKGMPSAVALLGLIPFGVGLAYLVFYYTGESRQAGSEGRAESLTSAGPKY